ncbi:unnamed protein product [Closterium sp. Naga37s-1]|nr:unnamed protein product [Closterium sp. Naga37s-1]
MTADSFVTIGDSATAASHPFSRWAIEPLGDLGESQGEAQGEDFPPSAAALASGAAVCWRNTAGEGKGMDTVAERRAGGGAADEGALWRAAEDADKARRRMRAVGAGNLRSPSASGEPARYPRGAFLPACSRSSCSASFTHTRSMSGESRDRSAITSALGLRTTAGVGGRQPEGEAEGEGED